MKNIAISIGDLNGIGIEIALKSHNKIKKICNPIYCINRVMLKKSCKKLNIQTPKDFALSSIDGDFKIKPAKISKKSGAYSFSSFKRAIMLAKSKQVDGIVTLPINKYSWNKANINYKGHTHYIAKAFNENAIMMIGTKGLFVAFFTDHIPLRDVVKYIKKDLLIDFFLNLKKNINTNRVAVLGLNPHSGDNGTIGDEDSIITQAINESNKILNKNYFIGPISPDSAFTPDSRKEFQYYISMYHDQSLGVVKALYFDKSINVTLNSSIKRASVDHGTAFDIAYKKNNLSCKSYLNAIKYIIK
jgi:4-hydroxythreonine-4-phosphate dehydrogenase